MDVMVVVEWVVKAGALVGAVGVISNYLMKPVRNLLAPLNESIERLNELLDESQEDRIQLHEINRKQNRKLSELFIQYYYEILFLIINLWLGVLLITVGHPFIALAVLLLVVFKSVSIIFNHGRAKVFFLTVMNTMWAFNMFYFLLGHHLGTVIGGLITLWGTQIITPEDRTIKLIRFGAGEDRTVSY